MTTIPLKRQITREDIIDIGVRDEHVQAEDRYPAMYLPVEAYQQEKDRFEPLPEVQVLNEMADSRPHTDAANAENPPVRRLHEHKPLSAPAADPNPSHLRHVHSTISMDDCIDKLKGALSIWEVTRELQPTHPKAEIPLHKIKASDICYHTPIENKLLGLDLLQRN